MDDHSGTTEPFPASFMVEGLRTTQPPILAATNWIQVQNPFLEEFHYIKQIQPEVETIDTIDDIDVNPYVLMTSSLTGVKHRDKDITDKPRYNIRNLVTNKEYVMDVTHIRHFDYDPLNIAAYVTPLNIAVKDNDETVV